MFAGHEEEVLGEALGGLVLEGNFHLHGLLHACTL